MSIVRLRSGGCEVRHVDATAADLDCGERQGVEADDDLGAAIGRAGGIATAARGDQNGRGCG